MVAIGLGSVDLEHTRVDLSDVLEAEAGDEVVLIGTQENSVISLDDVAAHQRLSAGVKHGPCDPRVRAQELPEHRRPRR